MVPVESDLLPMRLHQFRHEGVFSFAPNAALKAAIATRRATSIGRARNAGTGIGNGPACEQIGEQGVPFGGAIPAPVVEPRIEAGEVDDMSATEQSAAYDSDTFRCECLSGARGVA